MKGGTSEIRNLEFELLVLCSRTQPDLERIGQLLSKGISWPLLINLSFFHATYPLLYQSLSGSEIQDIDTDILARLKMAFIRAGARNVLMLQELDRLSQLFKDNEIPIIAFKGPVLAHVAYQDLGFRPCTDLDILVPNRRYHKVKSILLQDGYRPVGRMQDMGKARQSFHLYLSQQQPFIRGRTFGLDVHIRIMPPGFYYEANFDKLYDRSEQVAVVGTNICSFSPEDLIQILCFHGLKNRWERLKHICDVAELIRTQSCLDWDVVLERARTMRGMRILGLGLYLAHDLLDAELPTEVLHQVVSDKHIVKWGSRFVERLPEQMQTGTAEYKERLRFHLDLQDNLLNKFRYSIYSFLRRIDDI